MSTTRKVAEKIVAERLDFLSEGDKEHTRRVIDEVLRNERERCAKIGFEAVKSLGDGVYEYSITQKAAMVAAAIRKDDTQESEDAK